MQRRTRGLISLTALVTVIAAVSGCSSSDGPDSDATTSSTSSATESPTEPTETTDSTTTAPPTDSTSGSATDTPDPNHSSRKRAREAQIPAADLPGLNDQWVWEQRGAGPGPGQDVPSVCQTTSLFGMGAKTEYRTDYRSPLDADAYAVQMTGVFPDPQTVATAESNLKSWRTACKAHATKDLGLKRVDVGDLQTVSTDAGDGYQWLTTYGPAPSGSPDEGWFQALGFVADGDTLTVLVMANVGQDYNYESGQQPMDLAVQEAAVRLIDSRG